MKKALLINGVYETVLEEIRKSQEGNAGKVFYLQPYSATAIKQLESEPPDLHSPLPLYISTTNQLNQICYIADIVGWENKNELSPERLSSLNGHFQQLQPEEGRVYFEVHGKKCVNLISIVNLRKLANQFSTANLIKESDGEPLKPRTRSGGWSYVRALPLLSIENTVIREQLEEQFEDAVSRSLSDNDELRRNRLKMAAEYPEKVQTISYDYRRNSDVVAEVLKRSKGTCDLCHFSAPFLKASDGSPYLEVHHWVTLAEGGQDTVENAGALCPNCHKQSHFGEHREFIKSNKALPADAKMPRG